jgi:hypothetical protein
MTPLALARCFVLGGVEGGVGGHQVQEAAEPGSINFGK